MVLGFYLPPTSAQAAPIQGQPWYRDAMVPEINAWLTIAPDDTVTIRVAQTEMGTGVFTSCPMMVAEELQCDWSKVGPNMPRRNATWSSRRRNGPCRFPGGGNPLIRDGGGEPAIGRRHFTGVYRRMAHEFQRIGAREPLLSADGGRRSARTAAPGRRRRCGRCRPRNWWPRTASSPTRRADGGPPMGRSPPRPRRSRCPIRRRSRSRGRTSSR